MTHSHARPILGELNTDRLLDLAQSLVEQARRAGAEQAEAALSEGRSVEAGVLDGALETMERSESLDAGLRVLIGKQQAGVAFSDLSTKGQTLAVERAIAMAKAASEDPYCGLVDSDQLAGSYPDIQTYEAANINEADLETAALTMEESARQIQGVITTSGCGASIGLSGSAFVTSTGFNRTRRASSCGLGVAAVAKDSNDAMERDYDSHSSRRLGTLKSPQELGKSAGERAISKLGSEKLDSGKMSVVFDKRVSTTFLSSLLGAISGSAITRGTSFLRDKLGEQVFAPGINIVEDPFRDWSFGARAVDGEGVACKPRVLIEDGVLTSWLLNSASARQLGLNLTGHASRNLGGPPGISTGNLHMEAGTLNFEDLLNEAGNGLLVTEMFGPSLNSNTGDWSVGVSGFRISSGQTVGPVSEITVAGNMIDMFERLIPGSDLEFEHSINAPSILIEDMAVGGR